VHAGDDWPSTPLVSSPIQGSNTKDESQPPAASVPQPSPNALPSQSQPATQSRVVRTPTGAMVEIPQGYSVHGFSKDGLPIITIDTATQPQGDSPGQAAKQPIGQKPGSGTSAGLRIRAPPSSLPNGHPSSIPTEKVETKVFQAPSVSQVQSMVSTGSPMPSPHLPPNHPDSVAVLSALEPNRGLIPFGLA